MLPPPAGCSPPPPPASGLRDPHIHRQEVRPVLLPLATTVGMEAMGYPAVICTSLITKDVSIFSLPKGHVTPLLCLFQPSAHLNRQSCVLCCPLLWTQVLRYIAPPQACLLVS